MDRSNQEKVEETDQIRRRFMRRIRRRLKRDQEKVGEPDQERVE